MYTNSNNDSAPSNAYPETTAEAILAKRPSRHIDVVDALLSSNPDLVHKEAGSKPELTDGDSEWWESIEAPVTLADGLTRHTVSADYNAQQGWVLSIWLDEDIVEPEDARTMAAAMVRGAELVEHLSEATK